MKVLAFDPGGTTGWGKFEFDIIQDAPRWKKAVRQHFSSGQIGEDGNREEHHRALWTFLIMEHPDLVICERFDNAGDMFTKIISREYIGVIKLYCELFGIPLTMQGADQAMNFTNDGKLIMLGIHRMPAIKWRHANDAYRHLVRYLAVKGIKDLPSIRLIILEALRAES
jgi:hypothetical protein